MPSFSTGGHSASPPIIHVPRDYNTAHDPIERNLQAGRADKIAFIDDAGRYTFGELAERVNRFGSGLAALGIGMEDRVLLALADTIDFPTAFLGAIKAGMLPVSVNTWGARALQVPPLDRVHPRAPEDRHGQDRALQAPFLTSRAALAWRRPGA